jgi:hypothetical protein
MDGDIKALIQNGFLALRRAAAIPALRGRSMPTEST